MGSYVYCLKGPKHTVKIKINGETHIASRLAYVYKPIYCFFDKEPRWQILAKARIARMENIWRGKDTPRYTVVGDELKEGAGVIDWHSGYDSNKRNVSTYDDPDWGGRKYMGRLDKDFNVIKG
jgi:hypothetical protein